MSHPFLDRLAAGALLADGAMGTMLYAAGAGLDECFDALNLSQPETVGAVHRAYLEAGAGLIKSNTFGANRAKLAGFGLDGEVRKINKAGVRIARGNDVVVGHEHGRTRSGVRARAVPAVQQRLAVDAFEVQAGVDRWIQPGQRGDEAFELAGIHLAGSPGGHGAEPHQFGQGGGGAADGPRGSGLHARKSTAGHGPWPGIGGAIPRRESGIRWGHGGSGF
ncbi:homocysteine S-methyltransferase family protein [uncultured Arthrobacter sp.]|uniref:homocysteine S-methyltransferase family protein n=1 Tax=uncultured Arthrobacter sp. TaxID=114050 RepID=UPI0032167EFF